MTEKGEVNGEAAAPLYRRLTEVPDAAGEAGPVQWNFEKFLLTPDGAVVGRFRPRTQPTDPEVRAAIEAVPPGCAPPGPVSATAGPLAVCAVCATTISARTTTPPA